jgi:2-oxoglutarate ferredoxin oxidoreductase subunit alpha
VIPEMNLGQVAGEVQKYGRCDVIPIGQVNGEIIPPEKIQETLRRVCP